MADAGVQEIEANKVGHDSANANAVDPLFDLDMLFRHVWTPCPAVQRVAIPPIANARRTAYMLRFAGNEVRRPQLLPAIRQDGATLHAYFDTLQTILFRVKDKRHAPSVAAVADAVSGKIRARRIGDRPCNEHAVYPLLHLEPSVRSIWSPRPSEDLPRIDAIAMTSDGATA